MCDIGDAEINELILILSKYGVIFIIIIGLLLIVDWVVIVADFPTETFIVD